MPNPSRRDAAVEDPRGYTGDIEDLYNVYRLRVSNNHFNRDGDGRVVSLQEDSRDSEGC